MKRKLYLTISSLLLFAFADMPLLAHNVKVSQDVGVTFHIEPDHNPRVGTSSQAWFALTRQGGKLIPLEECLCQLKVYLTNQGRRADTPSLTPDLVPISPEQYRNIPGADLIFPQPGIYDLELIGKPAIAGDFIPFSVSYPVTVKPGLASRETSTKTAVDSQVNNQAEPAPTKETSPEQQDIQPASSTESEPKAESRPFSWLLLLLGSVGGGLAVLLLLLRSSKKT